MCCPVLTCGWFVSSLAVVEAVLGRRCRQHRQVHALRASLLAHLQRNQPRAGDRMPQVQLPLEPDLAVECIRRQWCGVWCCGVADGAGRLVPALRPKASRSARWSGQLPVPVVLGKCPTWHGQLLQLLTRLLAAQSPTHGALQVTPGAHFEMHEMACRVGHVWS